MANDAHTPLPAPPSPLPKRKNAVLRLFDAPVYRDWLFWFMVTMATIDVVAILTYDNPGGLPIWLTAIIGALFFIVVAGVIPAWIRLHIRRSRWHRRQQSVQAGQVSGHAGPTAAPESQLNGDGERSRRVGSASVRASGPANYDSKRSPNAARQAPTGLGVTAADPELVGIDEATQEATSAASFPLHVNWDRVDADGFERLLARLLELSGSYVRITRLMNINAADAGRDIQAYLRVNDLLSERYERVILHSQTLAQARSERFRHRRPGACQIAAVGG